MLSIEDLFSRIAWLRVSWKLSKMDVSVIELKGSD